MSQRAMAEANVEVVFTTRSHFLKLSPQSSVMTFQSFSFLKQWSFTSESGLNHFLLLILLFCWNRAHLWAKVARNGKNEGPDFDSPQFKGSLGIEKSLLSHKLFTLINGKLFKVLISSLTFSINWFSCWGSFKTWAQKWRKGAKMVVFEIALVWE